MFNEKPPEEELAVAPEAAAAAALPAAATLHTSLGDITVKLHGEKVPKTVENFVTHARNGYFDGIIFHRVIKDFMIQTGPLPAGASRKIDCNCLYAHGFCMPAIAAAHLMAPLSTHRQRLHARQGGGAVCRRSQGRWHRRRVHLGR